MSWMRTVQATPAAKLPGEPSPATFASFPAIIFTGT